jgi:hypothetical protein
VKTEPIRKRKDKPIMAIDGKETFYHMEIDLICYENDPQGPEKQYHYVAHMVDHFSSFHYVRALQAKSANEVLEFIRSTFAITGYPIILHSDNGSEFINPKIKNYLATHNIEYRHGKPYTPQTQGKVERGNQSLKKVINNLVQHYKNERSWFDVLYEAQMCLNQNITRTLNKSPYQHVYCMKPQNGGNIGEMTSVVHKYFEKQQNEVESEVSVAEEEEKGDLSPIIMERELITQNEIEVQQIRQDSRNRYVHNLDKMVEHRRSKDEIQEFGVGDVVWIVIPEKLRKGKINKMPVMVSEVMMKEKKYCYKLCYCFYLIEDVYYNHQMTHAAGINCYYGEVVTLSQNGTWEFYKRAVQDAKEQGMLIKTPLIAVYKDYCALYGVDNERDGSGNEQLANAATEEKIDLTTEDDQSNDGNDEEHIESITAHMEEHVISGLAAAITNKATGEVKQVSITIKDSMCCVCKESISNTQEYIRCAQCDRKMHVKSMCEFGIVQYKYKGDNYCSLACQLGQENYVVEIIKERNNKFLVKYKDGTCSWFTWNQLNYAEYAKIYADWRKLHPEPVYNSDDSDVEVL